MTAAVTSQGATTTAATTPAGAADTPETAGRRIGKRRARTHFAIPKVAFRRLVAEIAAKHKADLRLQGEGLDALQESAENLVAEHFSRCSRLAELCRLDTIRAEHWHFAQQGGVAGAGGSVTLLG